MDASQLLMKMISLCLRMVDSAGLSCFCTQRKSTDIFPKTPKTDWLTFLWVLILTPTDHFVLNPVCSCSESPMLASSLLCSRLGWDWNHHRPVKPHVRLEAVWCFWQKKRKEKKAMFFFRIFCCFYSYSVWAEVIKHGGHVQANDT